MNKKALSESDICDKFIRPAMERAGWNGMSDVTAPAGAARCTCAAAAAGGRAVPRVMQSLMRRWLCCAPTRKRRCR